MVKRFNFAHFVEFDIKSANRFIATVFNVDKLIACRINRFDEFVEFKVDGVRVAILSVLNKEHHKERKNGGSGIHNKLPARREIEERTGNCPGNNGKKRYGKSPGRTSYTTGPMGEFTEGVTHRDIIATFETGLEGVCD